MKCFSLKVLAAVLAVGMLISVAERASANQFANPGFEDPVTTDGAPFVGFWEAFNGGPGSSSANGTVMPRSGLQELDLTIAATANTFAGAFQDVTGLSAGQTPTFSGWHKLLSGTSGGTEIRIEWRNSVSDTEISRTPNLVPTTTADYTQFELTAAVPAGADSARAVYAIQSFGGILDQVVLLDDMSFVVPEPASLALVGMCGLALVGMRRRS